MKQKISKSLKKFVRNEKARIRRQVLDPKKQEEFIQEMYNKVNIVKPDKSEVSKKQNNL